MKSGAATQWKAVVCGTYVIQSSDPLRGRSEKRSIFSKIKPL